MLIGGLAAPGASSFAVGQAVSDYDSAPQHPFRLIAIPLANPGRTTLHFPPQGTAYRDGPESHALWRWIALQAPDLVLIDGEDAGLAQAFSNISVLGLGRIPARRLTAGVTLIQDIPSRIPKSEVRREIERREARGPRQLAEQLARVYGHDFDPPTYIPGMSLIAQIHLGNLAEVQKLAEPYANGSKPSLGERPSSLTLAGNLVFAELYSATKDPRYLDLVRKAAGLGFDESGRTLASMPFHDEMSDSVFMGTAIAARAGKLTGDSRYFDVAARHLEFMEKLVLRKDGLYRHSPLTDAAWGRGNAFPALGLTLALDDFPKDHPAYQRVMDAYHHLMAALAQYQDDDGMWHEVIDEPGSYPETSATAMIAFAMQRGVRRGWLGMNYQSRVERAWKALLPRISPEGVFIDVCESTNKQKTLDDYLNRAASFGRDARGGGMALLLAAEILGL